MDVIRHLDAIRATKDTDARTTRRRTTSRKRSIDRVETERRAFLHSFIRVRTRDLNDRTNDRPMDSPGRAAFASTGMEGEMRQLRVRRRRDVRSRERREGDERETQRMMMRCDETFVSFSRLERKSKRADRLTRWNSRVG